MPQYQHFIPQFILRKYSNYVEPERQQTGQNRKAYEKAVTRAKKKAKVNIISLEHGFEEMKLEVRNTSRVCGLNDMYGTEIERKFGLLEASASKIIRAIENDFASGKKTTRLSRPDKDTLRRFLFIMLYRRGKFYDRFEKGIEDYDSDDKAELSVYMHKKKFATPREVWLNNFEVFLDVPLGHDSKRWEAELLANAYPADAEWFIHHMNNFFLCFCRPKDPREEFLLTQNAYGVFEGPNSYTSWTDWHNFSPINPKLLIILRNNYIQTVGPDPALGQINTLFEDIVALNCSFHPDPAMARSMLSELPVARPRTSYQNIRCRSDGETRREILQRAWSNVDYFDFPFFSLSSKHVQMINSIFLENASSTQAIAFGKHEALCRALESFLQLDTPGFKIVRDIHEEEYQSGGYNRGDARRLGGWANDYHEEYLLGLERIAAELGSKTKAKHNSAKPNPLETARLFPPKFAERYTKLGWDGQPQTWSEDLQQAYRISMLHYATENLIKDQTHQLKNHVRSNRREILDSLPPRRIWLRLRLETMVKRRMTGHLPATREKIWKTIVDSPISLEDTIVDASSIFDTTTLSRLMMTASDMQRYLEVYQMDGKKAPFQCHFEWASGQIGSVLHCGSRRLEDRAAQIYDWMCNDMEQEEVLRTMCERLDMSIEIARELRLRDLLREDFDDVLERVLDAEVRGLLKHIFFDIAYPVL